MAGGSAGVDQVRLRLSLFTVGIRAMQRFCIFSRLNATPLLPASCPQERTYKRFFGLLAQRFCYIKREYMVRADCLRRPAQAL